MKGQHENYSFARKIRGASIIQGGPYIVVIRKRWKVATSFTFSPVLITLKPELASTVDRKLYEAHRGVKL